MLAFLRRNSVMSFTTDHRKLLYLTFVRSYIGYASEVWAPSTIGSITKIEDLQRRATKFILNTHWQEDISYHERLSRLNLLPLTYWHEVKDLIFYFKCRAGHYTLPIADYVKPKGTRLTRHSSDQDVLIPKCCTKLCQFSYASVNSNCAQAPPPGWPPRIMIFFAVDGKSPGVGTKKEGKCPVLRQQGNIFYSSHSPIMPC